MTILYSHTKAMKEWDQRKVDTYLIQEGFTPSELRSLRAITNPLDKLEQTGKSFAHIGWHNFSSTQLAMVVVEWDKQTKSNVVARLLKRSFGQERDRLNEELNLGTNNMQVLRERTGNYFGNFQEARSVWKRFSPGKNDWRNDVKIPVTIDRTVAQLLGAIWIDGRMDTVHHAKNPSRVSLQGRQDDERFYDEFMLSCIQDLFNYPAHVAKTRRVEEFGYLREGHVNTVKYFTPTIIIGSTAVATWLMNDFGYNIHSGNLERSLPELDWDVVDIRQGFFEGVIASRAFITVTGEIIGFEGGSLTFRDSLRTLLDLEDITYSETSRGIHVGRARSREVFDDYSFINPYQRERVDHILSQHYTRNLYTRAQLREMWHEVRAGERSQFPRGSLSRPENRMKLVQLAVEEFQEENPNKFPLPFHLTEMKLLGVYSKHGCNQKKMYVEAGYLDPKSKNYSEDLAERPWLVQDIVSSIYWSDPRIRRNAAEWLKEKKGKTDTSALVGRDYYQERHLGTLFQHYKKELLSEGLLQIA